METKTIVRQFILTELTTNQHEDLVKDDQSLLETGIIDSLGIMQLLTFIEEEFKIKVQDEELIPENFETINSILNLIEKKQIPEARSTQT